MANFCVLSQMKVKSLAQLKALYAHNAREYTPRNCNPEEHYLNETMISNKSYVDIFLSLKKKYGLKPRSNSVYALEYVSKFSNGTKLDLDEWKRLNQKFFEDTFGKKNVVSMIVHYDEHSPHIHTLIIPIKKKKKKKKDGTEEESYSLCARDFTGGKKAMLDLLTTYAEYLKPLGLKKGKATPDSKARHEDIMEFYKEITHSANLTLPQPRAMESTQDYIKRVTPGLREESMNYQRIIHKWKRELHDKELVLDKYKDLIAWANSIENEELLNHLLLHNPDQLEELLNKSKVKRKERGNYSERTTRSTNQQNDRSKSATFSNG